MSALTALVVALTSAAVLAALPPDAAPPATISPETVSPDTAAVDSTPATTFPDGEPTFAMTVPGGYVTIIDDTAVLAVVVPDTWTDVDTTPLLLDNRLTPNILAATDREAFVTGWDGAGASLIVTPFVTPDENIGRFTITSGCADGFTTREFKAPVGSPFEGIDDGLVTSGSGCGPDGTGTWTIAAVNDAPQTYSLVLVVQTPTDTAADLEVVALVLDHFGATPFARPNESVPVASTAVPATERSAPVH